MTIESYHYTCPGLEIFKYIQVLEALQGQLVSEPVRTWEDVEGLNFGTCSNMLNSWDLCRYGRVDI